MAVCEGRKTVLVVVCSGWHTRFGVAASLLLTVLYLVAFCLKVFRHVFGWEIWTFDLAAVRFASEMFSSGEGLREIHQ